MSSGAFSPRSERHIDPTLIQLDLESATKDLAKFKKADKEKKLKLGGKCTLTTHTFHTPICTFIFDSS